MPVGACATASRWSAFAEEEGQRFPATFLGSSALVGDFQPEWLDLVDAEGITLRKAMKDAGLSAKLEDIAALKRDPARYLGYVEVHIEQGPVLNARDLPLGIVTGINGSARFTGEATGVACHAGTTPMAMRQDAALAVAEIALYTERRALQDQDSPNGPSVGTVGVMQVPQGSVNVVPGSVSVHASTCAPPPTASATNWWKTWTPSCTPSPPPGRGDRAHPEPAGGRSPV